MQTTPTKPSTPTVRVALYARVSTDHQNTAMQLDELRQVAQQRGWKVESEYVDTISGAQEGPERRRLIKDAHRGRFDQVLVWRFDRFARSAKDLLLALDTLTSVGVGFASVREAFDTTTPIGRATVTILAAVAELEKNIIRERVCAGLDRARKNGKRLGRPRRVVDVDRALQLLAEGRSQRQVAVALKIPRATLRAALARSTGRKSPLNN